MGKHVYFFYINQKTLNIQFENILALITPSLIKVYSYNLYYNQEKSNNLKLIINTQTIFLNIKIHFDRKRKSKKK